ncbi:aromatic ring-hydroxylating dioxygenase subunit alpha [Xanthomonas euvesicatoria pv. euvesicatoria]|uniref:Aromatic ring-hydroxylating dioxygenase subunit alpha n=5 Tax=Xanthomonas euvesicatoria TaxID=456327 RepID=A0A6B3KKT5_XANEU|nr:aromatic ring-hydroxylating dioxygenase subunit alpha [Xanthomonas euvesicatoria]WVK02480.1 aromatic ring-hydroxylating dioxygenase subunit alpha [Xanthomonas campestris pv. olitorii]AEO42256.1 Phenylpropionate dioxygenase [Xanthomonas euvesicatoria pv. citrumelo F1]AOY65593.1 2Fe-2S ferredoxin [Xanthomonas euvesicatoria pv. vesicatoria str. 85-10]APO90729.1 2Fe-2S ferredoxin [Xanthomonas euvesicatoria]KHL62728.1 2Fe-2S ferredoxin [Xanthomonas euvesicatoria]
MRRHALDVKHYTSPHTFELEQARLFSRLWTFVGFSSLVAKRNQFFARQVAGVPVLVQRTDAGIRAFINQCPHRQSAIQIDSHGKRPLVCPYHAWSFGPEGELRGLPNPGLYQFTAEEKDAICLRKLHLEQVGQLLFVNLSEQPLPLTEQFSPEYLEQLRLASSHLDSQIIYSCHRVRYNWKLNMENVKDYNHVPFVHPKTFGPLMTSTDKAARTQESGSDAASPVKQLLQSKAVPALSELSFPVKAHITAQSSWFRSLCDRYGEDEAYYNWFVYPNVNFCSVRGDYFLLQQYDPVSSSETDYHLWVMTAQRKHERTDFTALLSDLIRGERTVIAEDTVLLERMQAGFGPHSDHITHGDYEIQLVRQHRWYRGAVLEETH